MCWLSWCDPQREASPFGDNCLGCQVEWDNQVAWAMEARRQDEQATMEWLKELGGGDVKRGAEVQQQRNQMWEDKMAIVNENVRVWKEEAEKEVFDLSMVWLAAGMHIDKGLTDEDVHNLSETAVYWDLETQEARKNYKFITQEDMRLYWYLMDRNRPGDFMCRTPTGLMNGEENPRPPAGMPKEREEWKIMREMDEDDANMTWYQWNSLGDEWERSS